MIIHSGNNLNNLHIYININEQFIEHNEKIKYLGLCGLIEYNYTTHCKDFTFYF